MHLGRFISRLLNALVQALGDTCSSYDHRRSWRVGFRDNLASGNPLVGNKEDVQSLSASDKAYLSHMRTSRKRTRPLPIALFCEHSLRFWFGSGQDRDHRDILLHTILIIDLNLGLRHDEVNKMKVKNVSVIPGIISTGRILLLIPVPVKNSTKGKRVRIT